MTKCCSFIYFFISILCRFLRQFGLQLLVTGNWGSQSFRCSVYESIYHWWLNAYLYVICCIIYLYFKFDFVILEYWPTFNFRLLVLNGNAKKNEMNVLNKRKAEKIKWTKSSVNGQIEYVHQCFRNQLTNQILIDNKIRKN